PERVTAPDTLTAPAGPSRALGGRGCPGRGPPVVPRACGSGAGAGVTAPGPGAYGADAPRRGNGPATRGRPSRRDGGSPSAAQGGSPLRWLAWVLAGLAAAPAGLAAYLRRQGDADVRCEAGA